MKKKTKAKEAQDIRVSARLKYDMRLAASLSLHEHLNDEAYARYCDDLDEANRLEGKKPVRR